MTKIGRRGFMLAEVVVVSMVVSTVLITLFTGVNNVSSAFETRNRYYDIDSMYAAIETNEILKRNNVLQGAITTAIELNSSVTEEIERYKNFYSSSTGDSISIYITPYNSTSMNTLTSINTNVTFSEYLTYLANNLDFSDDDYTHMIIVERKEKRDNDDCYYYALKL